MRTTSETPGPETLYCDRCRRRLLVNSDDGDNLYVSPCKCWSQAQADVGRPHHTDAGDTSEYAEYDSPPEPLESCSVSVSTGSYSSGIPISSQLWAWLRAWLRALWRSHADLGR